MIEAKFEELLGKTLVEIKGAVAGSEVIEFRCSDGSVYMMHHEQDCCEAVEVNDVCGDVGRLLNHPLTKAEEVIHESGYDLESQTWTFYHLATVRGYVCIRWLGESNGYYSERVDFAKVVPENIAVQKPDLVEVVRCKVCKHREKLSGELVCPYYDDMSVNDNHFCSYGERKDNG